MAGFVPGLITALLPDKRLNNWSHLTPLAPIDDIIDNWIYFPNFMYCPVPVSNHLSTIFHYDLIASKLWYVITSVESRNLL